MVKRCLGIAALALAIVVGYRWWSSPQPSLPAPEAFTEVCAAPACPDDEAIYALLRDKLGGFRKVPRVGQPNDVCALPGSVDVYRPSYTPDFRFALVRIIRDGELTESYTLLLKRTDSGWTEVGQYGMKTMGYDCNFW